MIERDALVIHRVPVGEPEIEPVGPLVADRLAARKLHADAFEVGPIELRRLVVIQIVAGIASEVRDQEYLQNQLEKTL